MVLIAALQLNSQDNLVYNIDKISFLTEAAAKKGALHIFTPENSDIMLSDKKFEEFDLVKNYAVFIDKMKELSQKHSVFLHIGSCRVPLDDQKNQKYLNQSISISPNGEIVARYSKIHLFDSSLSSTENYKESSRVFPGSAVVTKEFPEFKLGYSICYDIRFSYLYRILSEQKCQLIAIPAAFTVATGQAHWGVLVRARAIETSSYIVAAAQVGTHYQERKTWGNSMIISPWGEILAQGDSVSETILYAEYDENILKKRRSQINSLEHCVKIIKIINM